MLSKHFIGFLRDERGSYTLWSLVWFMIYVGIGGLAVDTTDAYRFQSLLQSTADSAALAGVMSLPDEDLAVDMALHFAQQNMIPENNGFVLSEDDVQLGTWNFATEEFMPGTADPDAVYVTTRRAEANRNPLGMNLLRFFGLVGLDPWWNVEAGAVAVQGLDLCLNNGMVAGGVLDMQKGNEFYNQMCLHGEQGMKLTNGNFFEEGVGASVGCEREDKKKCLLPTEDNAMTNEGFPEAWDVGGGYGESREPSNAKSVDIYLEKVIKLANYDGDFDTFVSNNNTSTLDYSGWNYLSDGGAVPDYYEGSALPDWALTDDGRYTVYHIKCSESDTLQLPSGTYRNMAIISTCPVSLNSGETVDMQDVMIGVDWWDGTPTKQDGLKFSGKAELGSESCGEGGVELMTRNSSVHFAAGGQINNSRLLSGWDIHMSAGGAGEMGLHMEAVNDINITSGGTFGHCPSPAKNVPQVLTYSLVR